ncbi:hypothetical protein [Adhaeribacter arboris]|uniref:hypothetical protein n=1 Tax=Adhaeribacter arboris TaxID=2072846 RepID=UPI0011B246A3|nr:hypothetical protein [Adhaeribacter arboris]
MSALRPFLLLHGSADEILPNTCFRDIYAWAKDSKEIKLYLIVWITFHKVDLKNCANPVGFILFGRAVTDSDLVLYPGCRRGLDDCQAEVDQDLLVWLRKTLG